MIVEFNTTDPLSTKEVLITLVFSTDESRTSQSTAIECIIHVVLSEQLYADALLRLLAKAVEFDTVEFNIEELNKVEFLTSEELIGLSMSLDPRITDIFTSSPVRLENETLEFVSLLALIIAKVVEELLMSVELISVLFWEKAVNRLVLIKLDPLLVDLFNSEVRILELSIDEFQTALAFMVDPA